MDLHGWSVISTLGLLLVVVKGSWQRIDRQMLAVIAVVIFIHCFYWFNGGPDFGARYWYLIALPCVVLTLRGAEKLGGMLSSGKDISGQLSDGRLRVLAAIAGLCVLAWATFIPWRLIDKYHHYRGARPDIRQLAEEVDFGRSLILIRGSRSPDYSSAAAYNPLDLEAPQPIYAWDRNPEVRAQLLHHYRDRPVWIIDGPTQTGRGFEVIQGPLSADDLLTGSDAS
jgi:hypothetical protein